MTRLLDRLEKKGLCKRVRSTEDRRVVMIELTPAQREALVAPLRERWNSNPDERARMIERAQRWKTMPRDQRDHARHGMQRWEHMSPEQRGEARVLFHAMRGMDKDQRKVFLADWRKKTAQQKAEWLKAHPAPERREQR